MATATTTRTSKAQTDANLRKTIAEAEQAESAAAESRAHADEHAANAELARIQQKHAKVELEVANIALAKCEREEKFAKVNDLYHKVYTFNKNVTEQSVRECTNTMNAWSRTEPGCAIRLVISSNGGSIVDGLALVDFLNDMRARGHKITTVALGWAASMAGVLLQAGDERVMGANALLLIHEGSLGVGGSFGEVEDTFNLMQLLHERILSIFESRAKPINPKTTKAFIKRNWKRKDWWVTAEDAKTLGLCDSIL